MAWFKTEKKNDESRRSSVLFLISTLYGGGAEKVCCVLASGLAERHDVAVLYFSERPGGRTYSRHPRATRIPLER